ncbi:hypothetical protein Anapl_06896, partial [Anas platyrhynchos]
RQVTVPPRHGGEPCPDLKQRRGCLGDDPACGAAKAVTPLLPCQGWPRCSPTPSAGTSGIPGEEPGCRGRRRLPGRCRAASWWPLGTPNCGPFAQPLQSYGPRASCWELWPLHGHPRCDGHGLQGARTFWVAASVSGCQGSWVREALQDGCTCPSPALVFV